MHCSSFKHSSLNSHSENEIVFCRPALDVQGARFYHSPRCECKVATLPDGDMSR